MSDSAPPEPKSPLREIIQPFVDLIHAPRALWGINLAYLIEGMVYFGMLGYLAIYSSDFIFQAIDGADEVAHYMVMILTAGITIAMFVLGVVADKRGVRFALIAAFIFMLIGRSIWAGGPNLFGLQPTRPGVFAGDKISLHVTDLDTRYGARTITRSEVIADDENSADVDRTLKLSLSTGEGIAPSEAIESRLVQLDKARIIEGEDQEWTVQYGSKPVTARLLIHAAEELLLDPGATISLRRAYIASIEKHGGETAQKDESTEQASADADEHNGENDDQEHEYIIRSNWVSDVKAVDTFPLDLAAGAGIAPDETLESWRVQLSAATIAEGEGKEWRVQYGQAPVTARMLIDSRKAPPLCVGATISVNRAKVIKPDKEKNEFVIEVEWPEGIAAVDVSRCTNAGAKAKALEEQLTPDLAVGEGTPPTKELASGYVQLGRAELLKREGKDWLVQYGRAPVTTRLQIESGEEAGLGVGALISLRRVKVVGPSEGGTGVMLKARWPEDFAAVDTFGCEQSPYRNLVTDDEKPLRAESRSPVAPETQAARDATPVTIAELRDMEDGVVNVVLRDVYVTYVRNGGYFLQADKDGPAIFVFVSPLWSGLQIVTLVGMLLVVIGYGMYQPAAYAGVRAFTTPKTAAMGFAMLYALMNLGGWLPTFAFLLRDRDYLGLGIPGTFWVYAGFTLVALLATVFILTRRTVAEAVATAKEETARIKAKEAAGKPGEQPAEDTQPDGRGADLGVGHRPRIKPHMWLFWIGAIVIILFKGEHPWYYTWKEVVEGWAVSGIGSGAVLRWLIAGVIFVSPLVVAAIPAARNWIAKHPLEDAKFAFFIFALIPVQTLFTYNWLVLPPYINRAYEGWIGNYFEIASNSNPLLIFIAVPIITALTQKKKVYNMMILGTLVMASPAFLLILGPHWWALFGYLLIMTIGEAMWQPRFLQYAAEIAPEGRTGEYMGVAQFPWFLTKVLVPLLYSGRMMDRYCPAEGTRNTEFMWFVFGCIAICSPILLILAKGWVGKDFKAKAD